VLKKFPDDAAVEAFDRQTVRYYFLKYFEAACIGVIIRTRLSLEQLSHWHHTCVHARLAAYY
jgi:hypothetical protein